MIRKLAILLDPDHPGAGGGGEFTPPKVTKPSGITPKLPPKEPPAKALEGNFEVDEKMFEDGAVTAPVQLPPREPSEGEKKAEEGKETEKKEETKVSSILKPPSDKKETEKKETENKPLLSKTFTPPSKEKVVRDYAGFSQEEVAVLKQMSDSAYKFTTDLMKQHKEALKMKDASFLQHPEAYTLSPEYRQLQQQVYFASEEAKIWEQLLLQCKDAKKIKPLLGFNKETGQPVFGEEMEPTNALEEKLRANVVAAQSGLSQFKNNLEQQKTGFQSRVGNDMQAIQNERKQRFAWVADEKLLDYTLPIEGMGDVSLRNIKTQFRSMFPAYLQNNIGVEVASDLFIALRIQAAELEEAKSGQKMAVEKQKEVERGEPSSHDRPAPKETVNGVNEFSLAGMPSL